MTGMGMWTGTWTGKWTGTWTGTGTEIQLAITAGLVVAGTFFLIVGTIGLLRLPNVYNRMHATSKPTTLGTAAIFLAGFAYFGPGGAGLTSLVGIVFLFMTAPTGAHMISRAAQRTGVPFMGGVTWPAAPEEGNQEGNPAGDAGDGAPDESVAVHDES